MKRMVFAVLDLLGSILVHVLFVLAMSGIAMFFWNVGVVYLIPSVGKLPFLVSMAIMSGIYIVDLFVKSYVNKIISYKQQKNLSELLFRSSDDDL